jgi:hypothetical protein
MPKLLRSPDHPGLDPLVDGEDVSWMPRAIVGDDQGNSGACALFSVAAWAEIVHKASISSFEVLKTYRRTLAALGKPDGEGLYFREALEAARRDGWIRNGAVLRPEKGLDRLREQPILAGYVVTDAWYRASLEGCLDHDTALKTELGYHAVTIIGKGKLETLRDKQWVYFENSWNWSWGWNGVGVMDIDMHNRLCREVWSIEEGG